MILDNFWCPTCKGELVLSGSSLTCVTCSREYGFAGGIPDLFVGDMDRDFVEDPNQTWLEPEIVDARDTVYRLCARELEGMAYCMKEIGRRSQKGFRILEVGMGTGHFTRWLHEAVGSGTEIYAFDFSWPIIEKAKFNTGGLENVTLFRANARGPLPFPKGHFDIVFLRLVPLGVLGKPNVQAGFELLKPGGWYFEGGWAKETFETTPTAWAIQNGFGRAEHHVWQYRRLQTAEERLASKIEANYLASMGKRPVGEDQDVFNEDGTISKMTVETLLIAQKPARY
jgi:SAM-dependent methyltransferase